MSLLLANGHHNAKNYTIGMVELEAGIVIERVKAQNLANAALTRLAISTIPNQAVDKKSTKAAADRFNKLLSGKD